MYFTDTLLISYDLFFFYRYDYHRDLHSFPTRRSSDLSGSRMRSSRPGCSALWIRPASTSSDSWPAAAIRSEEHTSELQSRQYLVCRLLLEKKNKQNSLLSRYRLIGTLMARHAHTRTGI